MRVLGKMLVFISFLSLFLFTNTYAYADDPVKMRNMCISFASRHPSGDWYDANGNLVYSIHHGYINGARIIDAYECVGGNPGGAIVTILEATGPRSIRMSWVKHEVVATSYNREYIAPYLKIYDLNNKRKLINTYYYRPGSHDKY